MKLLNKLDYSFLTKFPPPITINYRCVGEVLDRIYTYINERNGYIDINGHIFTVEEMYISEKPFDDHEYYIFTIKLHKCFKCNIDCSNFDKLLDKLNEGSIM